MKKNQKLKFLSESILLEESGLPFSSVAVIVSIAIFIGLFLGWSSQVMIEDSVTIQGNLEEINLDQAEMSIIGYATTNTITSIEEGSIVYINIPGLTGQMSLRGKVAEVGTEPITGNQSKSYYPVTVRFSKNQSEETFLTGMETSLKIITGKRTLLQYFLGSLYDTGVEVIE